jgi:hypothetical protein
MNNLFSSPRHGGVDAGRVSQRIQGHRSSPQLIALNPRGFDNSPGQEAEEISCSGMSFLRWL